MPADNRGGALTVRRFLRGLRPDTRLRVLLGWLRGRRQFVVLGASAERDLARPAPEPATPGRIVFRPEISMEWPLQQAEQASGTVARDVIPLPEELQQRIEAWASRWNRVMYENLYDWPDDVVREVFDREARQLCEQIAMALGSEWRVEYGGVDP